MTAYRVVTAYILALPWMRAIFDKLDIDSGQFLLLLDLFKKLGERQELMGRINAFGLGILALTYASFGILLSLSVFLRPSLPHYLLIFMTSTVFLLFLVLVGEAANILLNPEEALTLAHQPISDSTYVAAKLTHLFVVISVLVPSLNLIPALAGLWLAEARWFYPATHLLAAYLSGLFTAFLICGVYGWLFRILPAAKLKSVALGLQLAAGAVMPLLGGMTDVTIRWFRRMDLDPIDWGWIPMNWFVSFGLIGHSSQTGFRGREAALTATTTLVLIVLGLGSFSGEYLVRVSTLVGGRSPSSRRAPRSSWLGNLVGKMTGAPPGRAAFAFTGAMPWRDWQFRRQVFPSLGMVLIASIFIVGNGFQSSPFTGFSPIHFLPHLLGYILLMSCSLFRFTDHPQGAWIFLTIPFSRPIAFARGIYAALWIPIIGLPHLYFLPFGIWCWGWRDALLFAAFSTSLSSLYLSLTVLMIGGLPFANPFNPSKAAVLVPASMLGLMLAGILVMLQRLAFRSAALVFGATIAFGICAYATARLSLISSQKEIELNLVELAAGPNQMFKPLD